MRNNNKRILKVILSLSFILLLIACGNNGGENSSKATGEVTTLTFNHFLSSNHYIADAFKEWASIVEEKTDGRVKVELYFNGALGGQLQAAKDVSGGVYDIGEVTVSAMGDTSIFVNSIGNLPFAFDDIDTSFSVMRKFLDKYGQSVYEENNLMLMSNSTSAKYALHSRTSIKNVEDAKGKIINASANTMTEVIEQWGASREAMAFSELYQAMSRGTLDALWLPAPAAFDTSFYEVAPYITKFNGPSYNFQAAFVMNPKAFEAIPDDLKPLFKEELFPLLGEMHRDSYPDKKEIWSKINGLLEDSEGKVIELTPEEEKEFQVAAKPVWENWVKEANSRGLPGNEMMSYFKELLKEEGVEIPF